MHAPRPVTPARLLALLATMSCAVTPTGPLPAGAWGGTGIALALTAQGGTAEFDCGTGALAEAVVLDDDGRFDVAGTITPGHGGPEREGEVPDTFPARYRGSVRDGRMTLTIERDDGIVVGPFTLRAGVPAELRRCL